MKAGFFLMIAVMYNFYVLFIPCFTVITRVVSIRWCYYIFFLFFTYFLLKDDFSENFLLSFFIEWLFGTFPRIFLIVRDVNVYFWWNSYFEFNVVLKRSLINKWIGTLMAFVTSRKWACFIEVQILIGFV